MTCVAVVTQSFDMYCLESLNPAFAHVWIMVIEAVAVTIAMYCLIQFYVQIRGDIKEHKPLLKVAAIKLVIFLSFWQSIMISFLTSSGAVKASDTIQTPDIKIGIPAMLLDIEMAIFAIFHLWAFSYRPYSLHSKNVLAKTVAGESLSASKYQGGFLGIKAMADAFNPWDLVKAVGRSARWLFKGRKTRLTDASYANTRMNTLDSNDHTIKFQPTSYRAPGTITPTRYAGDVEGETLLPSAQPIAVSCPPSARMDIDEPPSPRLYTRPQHNNGDIGIVRTTYDDPRYEAQNISYTEQPYPQPYWGRETAVTAAPYPDSRSGGNTQMPYVPSPMQPRADMRPSPRDADGKWI